MTKNVSTLWVQLSNKNTHIPDEFKKHFKKDNNGNITFSDNTIYKFEHLPQGRPVTYYYGNQYIYLINHTMHPYDYHNGVGISCIGTFGILEKDSNGDIGDDLKFLDYSFYQLLPI